MREYKINSKGCKGDYFSGNVANTRHLSRILTYLLSVEKIERITQIQKATGLKIEHVKDALLFLTGNNLVFIVKHNSINYYFVNPILRKRKKKINFIIGNKR